MDFKRFDRFTKRLAAGHSRRTVLKGLAGGAAVASVPAAVQAQDATPPVATPDTEQETWLFVVDFSGAAVDVDENDATMLSVTLSGVDFDAVAFTDRPERDVRMVEIEQIAHVINGAPDDPLNAALIARLPENQGKGEVVLVLHSASFDREADTLTLDAEAIGSGVLAMPVTMEAGQSTNLLSGSLFIDDVQLASASGSYPCNGDPCYFMQKCCSGQKCVGFGTFVLGACASS